MQLFLNNWQTPLTASASAIAASMSVDPAMAALLGTVADGDYYVATLAKVAGGAEISWEVVHITAITGGALTVSRGHEGTTAQSWSSGEVIGLRVTSSWLGGIEQKMAAALTAENYNARARGGVMGNPAYHMSYVERLGGFAQIDFAGIDLAAVNNSQRGFVRFIDSETSGTVSADPEAGFAEMATGTDADGRMACVMSWNFLQSFDAGYQTLYRLDAVRSDIEYIEAKWLIEVPVVSSAAQRFETRLVLDIGEFADTPIHITCVDNVNSGNWRLSANLTTLADTAYGPGVFETDGWLRLRITPAATTGEDALVQLWLDNWNTGAAVALYSGTVAIPGLDTSADTRITWVPETRITKLAGTESRSVKLTAMQAQLKSKG